MDKQVGIFLNPNAGGGRGKKRWNKILASADGKVFKGMPMFAQSFSSTENLRRASVNFVKDLAEEGVTRFVAVGGDGTLHLALNAVYAVQKLLQIPLTLGAIAGGSANDFHKPHTVEGRCTVAGYRCRLCFDAAFRHDIGLAECLETSRQIVFACSASIGMVASGNQFFNSGGGRLFKFIKGISTQTAITCTAIHELIKFKPLDLEISCQDNIWQTVQVSNIAFLINPNFSGKFRYNHPYNPRFGKLYTYVAKDMTKFELLCTMQGLKNGKLELSQKVTQDTTNELKIRSRKPFTLETDGEVMQTKFVSIRILPQEILLCP